MFTLLLLSWIDSLRAQLALENDVGGVDNDIRNGHC
jgi:hypothetical protein